MRIVDTLNADSYDIKEFVTRFEMIVNRKPSHFKKLLRAKFKILEALMLKELADRMVEK